MSVQKPTVGRAIHYFPRLLPKYFEFWGIDNERRFVPATVTQANDDLSVNCTITPNAPAKDPSADLPEVEYGITIFAKGVPHKSAAGEDIGYWDWPVITK